MPDLPDLGLSAHPKVGIRVHRVSSGAHRCTRIQLLLSEPFCCRSVVRGPIGSQRVPDVLNVAYWGKMDPLRVQEETTVYRRSILVSTVPKVVARNFVQ